MWKTGQIHSASSVVTFEEYFLSCPQGGIRQGEGSAHRRLKTQLPQTLEFPGDLPCSSRYLKCEFLFSTFQGGSHCHFPDCLIHFA